MKLSVDSYEPLATVPLFREPSYEVDGSLLNYHEETIRRLLFLSL